MLKLVVTTLFRRDYKRIQKRGYDLRRLQTVVDDLLAEKPLDPRYKDHQLIGDMKAYRECHIQADWLLIYRVDGGELLLVLQRTGSHADLFDLFIGGTPNADTLRAIRRSFRGPASGSPAAV